MRYLVIASMLSMLTGCGTTPSFEHLNVGSPTDGAHLYVFRPKIDGSGQLTTPQLLVEGVRVAGLGREQFTILSLAPGRYTLKLEDRAPSGHWNATAEIELASGRSHFVAIWNQAQITNPGTTLPLQLPSGVVLPITLGATRSAGRVVFEVAAEDVGRDAVSQLRYVHPDAHRVESIRASRP